MGDRALIQIENSGAVSPVIYVHNAGEQVPGFLEEIAVFMKGRRGDVDYTAARLIGLMHELIEGNISLGIFNQPERLTAEDSHGDAGCFVYNCTTGHVEAFGGYGESFQIELD